MSTDIATRPDGEIMRSPATALSVDAVLARLDQVQDLMKRAMRKDVDYGVVPGTGSKPTLLKPGAEKLCVMFRLCPQYRTFKTFHDDGHLTVECTCRVMDANENFLGEASAMASTREAKYRYRGGSRVCPQCQKPAIKKSKYPPRDDPHGQPGWYCFGKIGGCGANFTGDDPSITSQSDQKVENPDLADSYNTVLRIAEKRALIGAVRLVTGSSALFDEEHPAAGPERDPEPEPEPRTNRTQKPMPPPDRQESPEMANAILEWGAIMDEPTLKTHALNTELLPKIRAITDQAIRAAVWSRVVMPMCTAAGLVWDQTLKVFIEPGAAPTRDGSDIPF